jgi:hypothetical protein
MARSTLKLTHAPIAHTSPVKPPNPKRGKRTVIPDKPPVAASCGPRIVKFKEPRVQFSDLFAFRPQSTGEKISVIRTWLHLEGLPEIPEKLSIAEFATIAARFLLPRHAWPLFSGRRPAEAFISEWAPKLLPKVIAHGPANQPKTQPAWLVPGIEALYEPSLLAARTI